MAVGTITKSEIDSLVIESGLGKYPHILHISGNIYACVYEGPGADGWLKTFSVNSEGVIGDAVIASLEFDTDKGGTPSIIRLAGTTYAITYTTSGNYGGDGRLYTLTISNDGLTLTPIDAWTFTSQGGGSGIVLLKISGTTYAMPYSNAVVPEHKLSTLTIADNGTITKSFIDTIDISSGAFPRTLAYHRGDLYIYASANYIEVIEIASNGSIASIVSSATIDAQGASGTHILKLNTGVNPAYYAMFFRESSSPFDGNVTTRSISYTGVISSVIENLKISNDLHSNYPINLSGGVRAWCEEGASNDGYLYTRSITEEGDITASNVDGWEFDEVFCQDPFMLQISGSTFLIVYHNVNGGGIRAFTLAVSNPTTYPSHPMARASSIRHIFRPGMFRMQVGLGNLGLDIDIAETAVRVELTALGPTASEPEEYVQPAAPVEEPAETLSYLPFPSAVLPSPVMVPSPETYERISFESPSDEPEGMSLSETLKAAISTLWRKITPWGD